jgi:DNA-directed RNA polymerase subunit RPC12/RpoP
MSRCTPLSGFSFAIYSFAMGANPASCQRSIAIMRCRAKPSTRRSELTSSKLSSASVVESGCRPERSGLKEEGANCRPEDEPIRHGVLVGMLGPGEPPAANEAPIDIDCVRPFDDNRLFRRRTHRERVSERNHTGVECAACGSKRLIRLQHNGKLGEVKAADEYECSGAELGGTGAGMGESVANLAQHHHPEGRRQVKDARIALAYPPPSLPLHIGYDLTSNRWTKYNGATRLTSKLMPDRRTLLVCSCENTIPLDARAFERGCRGADIVAGRQLCRAELERARTLLASGAPITIACTQEAPLFREIAAEGSGDVSFANIRENAGWSAEAAKAGPKMAALLAAAAAPMPDIPSVPLESAGVALVYGHDERAIEASSLLKEHLDITVLITRPGDLTPPRTTDFPIVKGTIRAAEGHLGAFEIVVDDYALPRPSSRDALTFGPARDGAASRCDIMLDISGGPPLFPAADLSGTIIMSNEAASAIGFGPLLDQMLWDHAHSTCRAAEKLAPPSIAVQV